MRGCSDVRDGETAEDRADIAVLFDMAPDIGIVCLSLVDSLFEDRRIGRHPFETVFFDQALEIGTVEEFAAEEIEPDGLTEVLKLLMAIHAAALTRSTWARAARSIASAVIPNFLYTSL